LKYILNILLKNIGFKSVFFHVESVCSAFSVGLSSTCVVDFGETKTSIAYVNEGYSMRKTQFVHIGFNSKDCVAIWWVFHDKIVFISHERKILSIDQRSRSKSTSNPN
jgi:actin-related protein 8